MLYAIFSDMHGNYPALRAALTDAQASGAERYLFLGDYVRDFPWPNETVEAIRNIGNHIAIAGNNEGYLAELYRQTNGATAHERGECTPAENAAPIEPNAASADRSRLLGRRDAPATHRIDWTREQFRPIYWNYNGLTRGNRDYLLSLPRVAEIRDGGYTIRMSHSLDAIIRTPKIPPFSSSGFRRLIGNKPITRAEYLKLAREALLACEDAMRDIGALDKGVYLFGHNHMQFHMECEGKVIINPGSCGVALDGDVGAAYTLLDVRGGGWSVTERRVPYDTGAAAAGLNGPAYAEQMPAWARAALRQLETGLDHTGPLVRHVMKTGRMHGETIMPVSDDVFRIAADTWDPDEIL